MTRVCLVILFLAGATARASELSDLYQASYDLETVKNYRAALAKMDAISASGAGGYTVALRRGWLLYLLGRYTASAAAYQEAIQLQPTSIEARQGLALPLMALRDWKKAEAACRDLLSRTPRSYLGMSRLAYVLYASGRYAEAAAEYAKVLQDFPSDVEMRTGLGWARLKEGQVQDARVAFAAVLEVAPAQVSAQQGLAACE
jgi:tetratricopeptide (TPR) repeat protein